MSHKSHQKEDTDGDRMGSPLHSFCGSSRHQMRYKKTACPFAVQRRILKEYAKRTNYSQIVLQLPKPGPNDPSIHAFSVDLSSEKLARFTGKLYTNDFNNIFKLLPEFYDMQRKKRGEEFGPWFVSGVPGSFYGRLFPSNSLDFVYSSYSLHWLSQV
ncbi:hypothetical protein RJ640_015438 [Escallonia rubra]|uniref:Uncharacterized protein n=1 Tax=Escallonia rubra TaxID=112253 RepID=A0AA88UV39_9ASTE|nr:hypothetical protein RJ640_015438 [Escallonia rubra]